MNSDEIMVSISCAVYNHEKYLRQCLEGFVKQKTNFKFEVLIHDDASTDGSADIIREYEAKYPDMIKPIYQTENQYSQGIKIGFVHQYPRVKGKYFAICEGDDYWCDENKLQRQFDALESNPNCSICTHLVQCIKEDDSILENTFPSRSLQQKAYSDKEYMGIIKNFHVYPFQTSSYFIRASIIKEIEKNYPEFMNISKVGDIPMMLLCANYGGVYFINEKMSCYRTNSIGSWTNDQLVDLDKKIATKQVMLDVLNSYNEFSNCKFKDEIEECKIIWEFDILDLKKDYKSMLKKKYRKRFKRYSIKHRMLVILKSLTKK